MVILIAHISEPTGGGRKATATETVFVRVDSRKLPIY